jgi:hypothetical protein
MLSMSGDETRPFGQSADNHLISFWHSRKLWPMALKGLIIVALVVNSIKWNSAVIKQFHYPLIYERDFIQEYLMAHAVASHINPYLPVSTLAKHFLGPLPSNTFPHPTPYPPTVGLLSLPLVLLSFSQATVAWLLMEIGCVVASLFLLLKLSGRAPGWFNVILCTLILCCWSAFLQEVGTGQIETLLLLVLVAFWAAYQSKRSKLAGALLGFSLALKLITWPIVIFLVLRKKWTVVGSALASAAAFNLAGAVVLGYQNCLFYYTDVGRSVIALYRSDEFNFSSYALAWKLFSGTGSRVQLELQAPAVFNAPILASVLSLVLPLIVLSLGMILAIRAQRFACSFGILVCVAILVNPVAWHHSLVLALIPLAIAIRYYFERPSTSGLTRVLIYAVVLMFFPYDAFRQFFLFLIKPELPITTSITVSPLVLLPVYFPAVGLVLLSGLLWKLDRNSPGAGNEPAGKCSQILR